MTLEVPSAPSPPSRIHRLPDLLVNQIAAGEVVERPASVVKELVENSLDALASRIDVLLTEGGIEEIACIDDGIGMSACDLRLAVERHTTSKLHDVSDLEAIGTYGFRGEALASIVSVADVELKSRPRESHTGCRLVFSHGKVTSELQPVGMPSGTAIRVHGLFSRLPARQKFLRTPATEYAAAARTFRELALGNPGVAFHLHHQGRRVAQYTAGTRQGRFRECLKPAWEPLAVVEESDGARIEAYLTPTHLVQDRGEVFLFVNERGVRNRNLVAAVRNAYLQTLGPHHEPSGVVFLDIRPDWVDVNVHPQKLEVRCLRQDTIYSWTVSAIRKAIASSQTVREIRAGAASSPAATGTRPAGSAVPGVTVPGITAPAITVSEVTVPYEARREMSLPGPSPASPEAAAPHAGGGDARPEPLPLRTSVRYLGQLRASYLLCEDAEGLLLIDQHALHEKRRFEQLKEALGAGPEGATGMARLPTQRLLVPLIARVGRELEPLLDERREDLERLGFDFEPYSDGDVAIQGAPELLPPEQIVPAFDDAVRALAEAEGAGAAAAVTDRVRGLLATLACHSVVKAKQALSAREAEELLDGLATIEEGWTCPHGRPVLFRLPFREIEKHFERS